MGLSNEEALEKLENEIMPPLRDCLEEMRDSIATIQILHAVLDRLTKSALAQFLNASGVETIHELNRDHQAWLTGSIVSNLNSALPLTYPWIIVVACFEDSEETRVGALSRKRIPGIRELMRTKIVPIVFLKTRGEFKKVSRGQIQPMVKFVDFPPKAP